MGGASGPGQAEREGTCNSSEAPGRRGGRDQGVLGRAEGHRRGPARGEGLRFMAPLPSVEWEAKREAVGREDREARGSLAKPPQGTAEQAWRGAGAGTVVPSARGGRFSLAAPHSLGVGARGPSAGIHPQSGLAKRSFGKEQGARGLKMLAKAGPE